MDKVSPSGAFMIDFLKANLPKGYFLFNLAKSFEVSPSVKGQLNEELLRYNTITTIPLAGTRKIGEEVGWKQPFVYRPSRYEQFDWIDDGWNIVGEVPEGAPISQRLEFKIRQGARLAEIDSIVYPALSRTGLLLGAKVSRKSYDLDILRTDIPRERLLAILRDEERGIKNAGDNIRDRVRLTFDVNYVHGLPEWTLQKPRVLVK